LTSSSLRRVENVRRLVAALAQGDMRSADVAQLLRISPSAARNYLEGLVEAGVACHDPQRRRYLRIHPDAALVQRFLAALDEGSDGRRISLRRSPSRHCVDPGAQFLHVLADDVRFPLVLDHFPVRRDPLVAALFGLKTP
jgi:hypothetical protein